jgi:hypothetical protein
MRMSAKLPPLLTWHTCQIIVGSLGHVVSPCILNQSRSHWLLSDALNFATPMSLKFKDEIDFATFDNLMEEFRNVVYELSCLVSNIKIIIF